MTLVVAFAFTGKPLAKGDAPQQAGVDLPQKEKTSPSQGKANAKDPIPDSPKQTAESPLQPPSGPLPVTNADLTEAAQADLDRLLLLLRLDGVFVNNARSETVAPEASSQEIERMSGSSSPIVRQAVRRLKPAIEMARQASEAEAASKVLIAELNKGTGPNGDDYVNAFRRFAHGLDELELDELLRKGSITLEEKEEYLRLSGKANAAFMQKLASSVGNMLTVNTLTFQKTFRLRQGAEVLRNNVVADMLAPLLQARAGKQLASPPLDVKLGQFSASGQGLLWTEAKLNLRSTSTQELTRMTLLFEFQTNEGSRYATVHVPKLPANGCLQVSPIQFSWMFLNDPPQDLVKFMKSLPVKLIESEIPESLKVGFKIKLVRYAAWCAQFRAEGIAPTLLAKDAMVNDTRLLAVHPGSKFRSEARSSGKDAEGRFELAFAKLTELKQSYEVEATLIDHLGNAAPQSLRGILTLPKVKVDNSGVVSTDSVRLKMNSGNDVMQLELRRSLEHGYWQWNTGKGLAAGQTFLAAPIK
jgi:hypothetical protein